MRWISLCAVPVILIVCGLAYAQTPAAEWTVMVWMNGDNNLQKHIVGDWIEMTRVAASDRVHVVVQLDLYSPDGTYRFKVKPDKKPVLDPKSNIKERNMVRGAELTEFVTWAMDQYRARRYALIFSSHGSGPRLLRPEVINPPQVSASAEQDSETTNILLPDGVFGSPNRAISADDHSGKDALYNREIAEALQAALPAGSTLDIIGFDACLMAMVELAYGLRKSGNIFVASEELIHAAGWDYERWLGRLVENPSMDATQLARVLVDSYEEAQETRNDLKVRTLAAFGLASAGKLGEAVSALGNAVRSGGDAQFAMTTSARSKCAIFAPSKCGPQNCFHHIDLMRFADLIAADPNASAEVRSAAERVSRIARSMRIANFAQELRSGDDPTRGQFGAEGLAIYFPETEKDFREDALTGIAYVKGAKVDSPIEFVEDLNWSDFLQAYYMALRKKQ